MCLDYGTPYRFYRVLMQGDDYPLECADKATLLALLREELAAGYYADEAAFHPFLALLLRRLTENPEALHPMWKEPQHPFCDVVQAVALVFGFANGGKLEPSMDMQEAFLHYRVPNINCQVFTTVRDVALKCCSPDDLTPWRDQMKRWLAFGGMETLLFEFAERAPDLITVVAEQA